MSRALLSASAVGMPVLPGALGGFQAQLYLKIFGFSHVYVAHKTIERFYLVFGGVFENYVKIQNIMRALG